MNEILPYREKPLSDCDFKKILTLTKKYFVFEPRMIGASVPRKDHEGNIYAWEHEMISDGYDFQQIEEPPAALVDAMSRPATTSAIKEHLFVLSRMKRYTGGDAGLFVIAREIFRHLPDCSEFVLMKICDDFALDTSSPFFPDPAVFIAAVKKLQSKISGAAEKRKPEPKPEPFEKPTAKQRRRAGRICKLAIKPKNLWTGWENKFMKFYEKEKA